MEALKITCYLMSGFATNDRWSPAIDGILAYSHMRKKLGPDEFALTQHRTDKQKLVDDLPLGIVCWRGFWWYAASSPIYHESMQHSHFYHRRFDVLPAERFTDKQNKAATSAGPFKNARLAIVQHIVDKIEWHVVGERDEIERLLQPMTHVGAKVSAGFGRVRRWEIESGDEQTALHYRPLPLEYVGSAPERMVTMRGLAPPFRHPDGQCLCVMP